MALAVALAGCAENPPAPTPAAQDLRPVPRKPRPIAHPRKPATSQQEEASVPEQQPGEAAPEPQPEQTALAVPTSSDLIGLDPQRTTALLGPAAQTNKRAPATVWHYKGDRCELDLSFYMEMKTGQMRTLHYDFKGEAASPEQRQACLRSIIEEHRKSERS